MLCAVSLCFLPQSELGRYLVAFRHQMIQVWNLRRMSVVSFLVFLVGGRGWRDYNSTAFWSIKTQLKTRSWLISSHLDLIVGQSFHPQCINIGQIADLVYGSRQVPVFRFSVVKLNRLKMYFGHVRECKMFCGLAKYGMVYSVDRQISVLLDWKL